ncbi:hypothetical protein T11_15334 [Trichinella zimbabwensis]|uniref:Uncharacterized protein n=1 Tax=Trichinella zimbabwensis TaxID=268475 RepID=A0A0V1I2Y6_9BILA|nr:hypothetical protein T11_15334 [Trichinella zimbabwensis]
MIPVIKIICYTVGGTANAEFPRILAASIHTPCRPRCLIILRNCLKAAWDITDRLLICMLSIYLLPEVEGLSSASFVKNTVTTVVSSITYLLKFCIILTQWTFCTSRHVWTSCQASGIAGSLLP